MRGPRLLPVGLLLLEATFIAARLPALPVAWQVVEDLAIHDGQRRRLLTDALLDEVHASMHVFFRTEGRQYEALMHHVNLWADDAKLFVNAGGNTHQLSVLPRLPSFRGHLLTTTGVGSTGGAGGVSAVVMGDGMLRMHIYEDGHDVVLDSAAKFDTSSDPELRESGSMILYPSAKRAGVSGVDSRDGLGGGGGRRREGGGRGGGGERLKEGRKGGPAAVPSHRQASSLSSLPSHRQASSLNYSLPSHRQASSLNSLPVGPPYGRLSSCPSSGFYTSKIGIMVDHGFTAAVGGTEQSVLAEIASIFGQTNLIYHDQVHACIGTCMHMHARACIAYLWLDGTHLDYHISVLPCLALPWLDLACVGWPCVALRCLALPCVRLALPCALT